MHKHFWNKYIKDASLVSDLNDNPSIIIGSDVGD